MSWDIAIIGAGYVGVPLAQTFAEAGQTVVLVDVVDVVVDALNRGESHIEDVPSETLKPLVESGAITATTDYDDARDADAILIAVPTPLSRQREPDLSYVESAAREHRAAPARGAARRARVDDVPGHDARDPAADPRGGQRPEGRRRLPPRVLARARRSRATRDCTTKTTPKVVGGVDAASTEAAAALYGKAIDDVHAVSTPEAAELTKLLENIFRSVNIALVNELAQLCDRMDIDVWEVVDAAATKPFGFMSFKPGPGLGGHCIPIDPFYLTWKAREFGFYTRFIELAGEVNENMPYFCRSLVSQALNHGAQKSLKGSKILVLGVAYKPDIDDVRESPALKLIELLAHAGADVAYHDPHVPAFDGLHVGRARAGGVRLRRDRDRALGDRLRRRRATRQARRRLPQRDEGRRGRTARSGSCERRRRRARLLGPEPRAQLRRARRARLALRPRRRAARSGSRRATRARGATRTSTSCSPTSRSTASSSRRRCRRTTRSRSGRSRPASTCSSRSRRRCARAEMDELVALARERDLVLMPGHLLLYHPGVRKLKELIDARRARRRALRLRQPPEPRQDPHATRTRSGRSACTTSR